MRSYGPRIEHGPDGVPTRRVSQAHEYSIDTPLYMRRVGNGRIVCRMLRASSPAKRIIQLVADYEECGVATTHVVGCESEAEEIRELERLERIILAAERRPAS